MRSSPGSRDAGDRLAVHARRRDSPRIAKTPATAMPMTTATIRSTDTVTTAVTT